MAALFSSYILTFAPELESRSEKNRVYVFYLHQKICVYVLKREIGR